MGLIRYRHVVVVMMAALSLSTAGAVCAAVQAEAPALIALQENPADTVKLEEHPLSGKPYRLAEQAYQALAAGKVDEAARLVAKALRMRPDSKQLGALALDIQLRKGELAGGKLRADDLIARYPNDAQLHVSRGYLLQRLNNHHAAVSDFALAMAQGSLSADQEYDLRLAFSDSAMQIKRPQQALDVLIPLMKMDRYAVQIRLAQARMALHRESAARAAAHNAIKLAGNKDEADYARRIARLTAPALSAAGPVAQSQAEANLLQQAYELNASGRYVEALDTFKQAFEAGESSAVAYADAGYVARRADDADAAVELLGKSLKHSPALSQAQEREVRLVLSDIAAFRQQPQQVFDVLSPIAAEPSYAVQIRLAQAQLMMGHKEQALTAALRADEYATTDSEHADAQRQLKVIRALTGNTPLKRTDEAMEHAYAALAQHDDKVALSYFHQTFAAGNGNPVNFADAGYAAKRQGKNAEAVDLLGRALAGNEASPVDAKSFDADQIFGYERELQQMNRTWGFSLSLNKQHAPPVGGRTRTNNIAGGADVYWQPYFNNGRLAQVYVSSFETLSDYTGTNAAGTPRVPTGVKSALSAVGVRYKPFGDYGVMLSAEKQVDVPNGYTSESLVKIGYSSDNGTDIKPVAHDWSTFQFYALASYYLASNNRYIYSAEGTYGRSFHVSAITDRLVVYPHYGIAGYFDSNQNANAVTNPLFGGGIVPPSQRESWSYGPGVKFRYWLPERGRFSSASVMDMNIQYHMRRGPGPNVQIGQGLLVSVAFWY